MTTTQKTTWKAYQGLPMDGLIATLYTKNVGRDLSRFTTVAQAVTSRVAPGSRVLEVAPGPGFLAIELAKTGRYRVTGLDISESFVRIAQDNARKAGVAVDFRCGNASAMPFANASFDFLVCMAAFKNFSDPLSALNEIHRVLAPGGEASIYDLRKDASLDEIARGVRRMQLSPINALLTRFIFRFGLLRSAYTREALEQLVTQSRFGIGQFETDGIGFGLRFAKRAAS